MEREKIATILVVDSDEMLRTTLAFDFQRKNFRVLLASSGDDAFNVIQKEPVDLVLSDSRVGSTGGVDFLKLIKGVQPEMPVIMMMTGHADFTLEEALDEGAFAVVSKPFDRDHLFTTLQTALAPKQERWNDRTKRQLTELPIQLQLDDLETAITARALNIGQGGLFISVPYGLIPRVNSEIRFSLKFQGTNKPIEGIGLIRWVRGPNDKNLPVGFGMEFLHLNEDCRGEIISLIDRLKTKSYIPKS